MILFKLFSYILTKFFRVNRKFSPARELDSTTFNPLPYTKGLRVTDKLTDGRTEGQTDDSSRSYCMAYDRPKITSLFPSYLPFLHSFSFLPPFLSCNSFPVPIHFTLRESLSPWASLLFIPFSIQLQDLGKAAADRQSRFLLVHTEVDY